MTPPDGLPPHMDRFAIDALTAERLLRGVVGVGDAPPEYRAVARVFEVLGEAPDSAELVGRAAAVDRIAAAVVADRRPSGSRRSRRSASRRRRRAAAAIVTCALILTTGLTAAGALPKSAQSVASTVLRNVGISVPTGGGHPADQQPPPTPSGPAPTATGSVPPTPTGKGSDVPALGPDASPASPHGNGQGDLHGTPSRDTGPPTAKDNGSANSPSNKSESGHGNQNGHEK
jgi:hypothetical protein